MNTVNRNTLRSVFVIGLVILCGCEEEKNGAGGLPVDGDGNEYDTVVIGTQVWLKSNLKTTRYNNGIPVPLNAEISKWQTFPIGEYCWYNNDANNKDTYGALYDYKAVKVGALCPVGWHIPTIVDWTTLIDYLGGEILAGGELKETGTSHWTSPNSDASNSTGFAARPGGYRTWQGTYDKLRDIGYWWSSENSRNVMLFYQDASIDFGGIGGRPGFSVRCTKDK